MGRGRGRDTERIIQRVLLQLRDPGGTDVVFEGAIPAMCLAQWPRRVTDEIVITRRQRQHYLDEHPEMIAFEEDLIRILLDPDEVHTVKKGGAIAAFFGEQDATHDVNAVVAISSSPELKHSVITARRQRKIRRTRGGEAARKVWEK